MELAEKIAGSMARRVGWKRYDDLRSAAYLGLVTAGHRFDDSYSVPFRKWAAPIIKGAVVDLVRHEGAGETGVSQKRFRAGDFGEEDIKWSLDMSVSPYNDVLVGDLLADPNPGPEEVVEKNDDLKNLLKLCNELPEPHRSVIHAYDIDERTQIWIAEQMGRTISRVSQIRTEALFMLKVCQQTGKMPVKRNNTNRSTWRYEGENND